ncbi:MAG: hypothetical protein KDI30_07945 [Pseudomonadales bacterium]|nr:hypothetical protein [Pseudomonadales bacterium]
MASLPSTEKPGAVSPDSVSSSRLDNHQIENAQASSADLSNHRPAPTDDALLSGFDSLESYLESIEKNILEQALQECRWNKTATAKRLGMSFRQLRYRLKKLGIED